MNGQTQQASRRVGRTRSSKAFLTKAGLIEEVSQVTQTTGKTAKAMVEAIIESMVLAVRSGNKVEIRGFGSFRTRARRPRIGRNPKTRRSSGDSRQENRLFYPPEQPPPPTTHHT